MYGLKRIQVGLGYKSGDLGTLHSRVGFFWILVFQNIGLENSHSSFNLFFFCLFTYLSLDFLKMIPSFLALHHSCVEKK